MVAVETIWQLLEDSGLIAPDKIPSLKTKFNEEQSDDPPATAKTLLKWLVGRKRITLYHARILAAGQPGPFIYTDYQVYEKTSEGPLANTFRALHRPSNHAVRLHFFAGSDAKDGEVWQHAMALAEKAVSVNNPFVVRLFEAEGTDQHRFLVTDDRSGKTLSEKLPRKGRLPWIAACQAVEQIVLALEALHRQNIVHGNLCPARIWIRRSGTAQLMWPIPGSPSSNNGDGETAADYLPPAPTEQVTKRTDLYSIGALLYRLITGKPPTFEATTPPARAAEIAKLIEKCKKYDSPGELNDLIGKLLMADVEKEFSNIEQVQLGLHTILGSNSIASDIDTAPATLPDYEKSLEQKRRSAEFFDQLESMADRAGTDENPNFDFSAVDRKPIHSLVDNRAQRFAAAKNRSSLYWIIGISVVLVSIILGILLGRGGDGRSRSTAASSDSSKNGTNEETGESLDPVVDLDPGESANLSQQLIADDGVTLWESPTNGPPLDVAFVPPSPDFLISARPRDLVNQGQGRLFMDSLGKEFERKKEIWLDELGMELEQMELVTISLHSNPDRRYSTFFVIHLVEPAPIADILQSLGDPAIVNDEETSKAFYQRGELAFRLDHRTGQTETQAIAFGPTELIRESLARSGEAALHPAMEKLIRRTDQQRHLNLVYMPNMLSSDESLWLFSGKLSGLRRPLQLFFDERVASVLLSFHIDDGNYFELMAQRTLDIRADELVRITSDQLKQARDELASLVDRIPRNNYWDPVRTRYNKMIQELYRNTRVGVERGEMVANCWLPPMALHNLVASSELVLASTGAVATAVTDLPRAPQTLDQLLSTARDLSVTSQPDLINLLSDLAAEVNDDFPTLPFEFQIKLMGPDLLKEGITQNQRLPDLTLQDTALRDVLTEIVFRANPDKEATGPADEKCKLVWVIANDPDSPGRQIVVVTTRSAAAENGYSLPAAFQGE